MADQMQDWENLEENGDEDGEPMAVDNVGDDIPQNDPPLLQICVQHLEVLREYFKRKTGFKTVEELGRQILVIPTPVSLFPKHLVDRPIDEWKAKQLARDRGRLEAPTTVFEDPGKFYFYPELEVIVSHRQVKKYRVTPMKPGPGLNAYEVGLQFAVFDSVFHFDPKKDFNVTPIKPGRS